MRQTLILLTAITALAVNGPAYGQSPVVAGFTGGSSFGIFYADSTGDVVGFRFTADSDGFVTDLGVLDDPADGVLDSSHEVGLWRNSDMALLASASVSSSDTLMDGFYYQSITPVAVTSGTEYTLGAMYTATDNDSYISSPATVTLDGISSTNGVFPPAGDLGFVYPASDSTNLARLGPNAKFIIPEPATASLMGIALAVACLFRRR
jgi:hypothetical protein